MNPKTKKTVLGVMMLLVFGGTLIAMFLPLLDGRNVFEYMDNLFNSISKGSVYYVPALRKDMLEFAGCTAEVDLQLNTEREADQTALLYRGSGAQAVVSGTSLKVTGDVCEILQGCLDDADVMYANDGKKIEEKYGYGGKLVLFNWYSSLHEFEKELCKKNMFEEAEAVSSVKKKAVATAYNYYEVKPRKITERIGTVIFSLAFYVVYTMWYGFAIMYVMEGWGLKLGH
jgi:hypothetical protein